MVAVAVVEPRIHSVPAAADRSLARRCIEFARRAGMSLDPEQELVIEGALGLREDGRWQCFEVGLCVPRQNGKGEILIAVELFFLFDLGVSLIVHSAHDFKTSERHFERVEAIIRSCPGLLGQVKHTGSGRVVGFRYSHGDEAIETQDGRKIVFRTRTKSGMRGFDDVGLLVLDESMIISEWAHGTMLPTLRASKAVHGPQLWYTGSSADEEKDEHAIVMSRIRERGLAGDPSLAYFEWSLDYEHPDDIPEDVMADPEAWRRVNFAIGRGRVLEEHMEREYRSLSPRMFAVELLGVGVWPATDGSSDVLLSLDDWKGVEDGESRLVDPVCLAFDVSPDRRTSVAAAGRNEAGRFHVELITSRAGTGWVTEALERYYRRHEIEEIVCDGYGPSAAIARKADEAGITVRRLDSGEYGQACGMLVDAVGERTVRHIGQDEIASAIRGAKARPLVDRWAWSRTKSTVDISPLVAVTLALFSAVENDVGEVHIF